MKDINLIGRDLKDVLIVDNLPINLVKQKDNAILIKPFYGEDADDDALYVLGNILKEIYEDKSEDIRLVLKKYKSEIFQYVSISMV